MPGRHRQELGRFQPLEPERHARTRSPSRKEERTGSVFPELPGEQRRSAKLVREKVVELYDLETDIGERVNLAGRYPQKVRELEALTAALIRGD